MWFFEGGLAFILATVFLNWIAQSVTGPAHHKMIHLSGVIRFAAPGGKTAVRADTQMSRTSPTATSDLTLQKVDCSGLTVTLADAQGTTLGSASATTGSGRGTCTYDLRGRESKAMHLTVTETTEAIAVRGRSGHTTYLKIVSAAESVDPQKGSTQTVPLTVTVE